MPGVPSWQKDHSGEKECIWLGWTGVVRQEVEATLDLPCHRLHKGRLVASPKWALTHFPRPPPTTTEAAFGKFCVIGWRRRSGSLMTQTWSWLSLITLALYIHPIRMNSALHKSTREKYWFYTIHFLKYIQSKISYVSIMSCSQSALVCNYMHLCVSVYQNIQYISHSRESLKAATYLVKEWVLREDLLKGTLLSKQINKQIYFSFYTPWRQTSPTGLQLHVKYPNIYNLGC